MSTKPNDPAFPVANGPETGYTPGLTKREYFAAMALQALITDSANLTREDDCEVACDYADLLIAELNKDSQ